MIEQLNARTLPSNGDAHENYQLRAVQRHSLRPNPVNCVLRKQEVTTLNWSREQAPSSQ